MFQKIKTQLLAIYVSLYSSLNPPEIMRSKDYIKVPEITYSDITDYSDTWFHTGIIPTILTIPIYFLYTIYSNPRLKLILICLKKVIFDF